MVLASVPSSKAAADKIILTFLLPMDELETLSITLITFNILLFPLGGQFNNLIECNLSFYYK